MRTEIQDAATFPQAVLLRSQMDTSNGSFDEVIVFLDGYYSGNVKGDPYARSATEWTSFEI